jgi:hypothetical protein
MVSGTTSTSYSAAEALNLFYKEYDTNCAGYRVMIDGIDVDLTLEDDDNNEGVYEQNEVTALYRSSEETKRKAMEQAKDDAPFFVNYQGGSVPSMSTGYTASTDYTGFYVKEGKYIGKASNAESGDYIRILIKDLDYSVVDNVEDFFDIPDEIEYSSITNAIYNGTYVELESTSDDATQENKINSAMSYFISQGFTAQSAAGIVGNLMTESGLNASSGSKAGYHGIAQWNTSDAGGHWWDATNGIKNWLISNGYNEDSFAGQVRAIYEAERRGQMTEARWTELKSLTDPEKAAEMFAVYYEACIGSAGNSSAMTVWYNKGKMYQALKSRKENAITALNTYTGASNN